MASFISSVFPSEAAEKGVELHYVNTAGMEDPVAELKAITGGKGYSDVFVYAPVKSIAEMGNKLLAEDGCMNFFAGPTDTQFSANMNLYDCHYARTKIMGSTGGNTDDMKEAIEKSANCFLFFRFCFPVLSFHAEVLKQQFFRFLRPQPLMLLAALIQFFVEGIFLS